MSKMKLKTIAMLSMMALVLGLLGPVQEVIAGCSVHSNYVDRVEGSSNPVFSTHKINTGDYVNGSPIYKICTITTVYITHGIYCGVCNEKMSTYVQTIKHHSRTH